MVAMIKQKEDRMIRAIGWLDHYWIGSGGFENFPAAVDKTKTPDGG